MAFVTDSTRPQPLWQPPPTACLTASGAASEAPSLPMHLWVRATAGLGLLGHVPVRYGTSSPALPPPLCRCAAGPGPSPAGVPLRLRPLLRHRQRAVQHVPAQQAADRQPLRLPPDRRGQALGIERRYPPGIALRSRTPPPRGTRASGDLSMALVPDKGRGGGGAKSFGPPHVRRASRILTITPAHQRPCDMRRRTASHGRCPLIRFRGLCPGDAAGAQILAPVVLTNSAGGTHE